MAIMFNPQALSRFANVNFGKDKSIVNLGTDKETLVKNNELDAFSGSLFDRKKTRRRTTPCARSF